MKGEVAAIVAACLWAVASAIYSRLGERIPALQINLIKGIVSIILFVVTILWSNELLTNIPVFPFWLLLLSGAIGIGLGDTAFLSAMNALGARRALLMQTLSPPITAILALIFLDENLKIIAWFGIVLTVIGVAWVVTERTTQSNDYILEKFQQRTRINLRKGIILGLVAAFANAIGAVFSRVALSSEDISISPLWAALLRLSAGVIVLFPWLYLQARNSQNRTALTTPYWKSPRILAIVFFAVFCGTYLGIWLQQVAIKFTAVGIASTLLQTSPIFIIPIAIGMGERVSPRAILGVLTSLVGIVVLFYLG
ncbi:MAG: DMT family transporter [Mastigocoleus sp. MO_167.B18]|nr:DMT family transporter [Mastigocoleus sp. MO_167.B18]